MRVSLIVLCLCLNFVPVQAMEDQQVVNRIFKQYTDSLGKNHEDYTVEVVESEQINAFATLGNKIVVNTALIEYLDTEVGLAFVIAHELGHLERHHVYRGIFREGLASLFRVLLFKESRVYEGVNQFHRLHYSRGKEREADLFAEQLITQFYCKDPGKLEFFAKMSEEMSKNGQGGKISEYFSTHPLPASRLEYLTVEIQAKGCVI